MYGYVHIHVSNNSHRNILNSSLGLSKRTSYIRTYIHIYTCTNIIVWERMSQSLCMHYQACQYEISLQQRLNKSRVFGCTITVREAHFKYGSNTDSQTGMQVCIRQLVLPLNQDTHGCIQLTKHRMCLLYKHVHVCKMHGTFFLFSFKTWKKALSKHLPLVCACVCLMSEYIRVHGHAYRHIYTPA